MDRQCIHTHVPFWYTNDSYRGSHHQSICGRKKTKKAREIIKRVWFVVVLYLYIQYYIVYRQIEERLHTKQPIRFVYFIIIHDIDWWTAFVFTPVL